MNKSSEREREREMDLHHDWKCRVAAAPTISLKMQQLKPNVGEFVDFL